MAGRRKAMSKWGLVYWDEDANRWLWRTYEDHIPLKEGPLDAAQNRKLKEPTLYTVFRQQVSNHIPTSEIVVIDF
jgi:hypothetical protein